MIFNNFAAVGYKRLIKLVPADLLYPKLTVILYFFWPQKAKNLTIRVLSFHFVLPLGSQAVSTIVLLNLILSKLII